MPLTGNASQGCISHLANTLVRLLQDHIPVWGRGAIIVTAKLLKQVRDIVRRNPRLLGSTFVIAGVLILFPSLIVTTVRLLGFTTAGVLKGSVAALTQGLMYGGQTAGLFSAFQAFGATAVLSPVAIGIGLTLCVVGIGFPKCQKFLSRK